MLVNVGMVSKMAHKDPEVRKAYDKAYREKNKDKLKAAFKDYYEGNKEKFALKAKVYREDNKEALDVYNKNWGEANRVNRLNYKKSYRVQNKELISSKDKIYRKENKGIVNAKNRRRELSKINRTPTWLSDLDKWLIDEIYHLSALRTELTGVEWHVDHIIPLQGEIVSGLHVPSNLQVITAKENLIKGNRL